MEIVKLLQNAFKASVPDVIKSLASVEAEPFELETGEEKILSSFVSGNFAISGSFEASISICFSKGAVSSIFAGMLGEDEEPNIGEIGDMVGEISNMISGRIRKFLSDRVAKFEASDTTVTIGDRQYVHHPEGSVSRTIPFRIDGNLMFVEVLIYSSPVSPEAPKGPTA